MQTVRKLFGHSAGANRSIAPPVEVARLQDAPPRTPADQPAPQPAKPLSGTPTERRLKLIIESAPVSLIIVDSQGQTLAANRASLTLFGASRLEDVVAKNFDACVCPEDREAFITFVTKVCQGELGSLRYEVIGFDGTRRRVETQAVPLRRDGSVAAFLGASWIAAEHSESTGASSDIQSRYEQLRAECDALNDALASTKAIYEETSRERQAERESFEDELRTNRERLQASLAEAARGHEDLAQQWSTERETLTSEWTSERESLVGKVQQAEERHAVITSQLFAEQLARQNAVEHAKSEYETSLAAARAEMTQQRAALDDVRREHEATLAAQAAETRELQAALGQARSEFETALAAQAAASRELQAALEQARSEFETALAAQAAESREHQAALEQARAEYERTLAIHVAESRDRESLLEAAKRGGEAALAAHIEESSELKNALSCAAEQHEKSLADSRATCDELRVTIRDVERRAEDLCSELNVERATWEGAVKAERARYEALLGERERWLAELADVFEPLKATSARVGRLLDAATAAQPAVAAAWEDLAGEPEQTTEPSTDMSDVESNEEDTWQF